MACSAGLGLGCGSDPAASFPSPCWEQLSSILQHTDLNPVSDVSVHLGGKKSDAKKRVQTFLVLALHVKGD